MQFQPKFCQIEFNPPLPQANERFGAHICCQKKEVFKANILMLGINILTMSMGKSDS